MSPVLPAATSHSGRRWCHCRWHSRSSAHRSRAITYARTQVNTHINSKLLRVPISHRCVCNVTVSAHTKLRAGSPPNKVVSRRHTGHNNQPQCRMRASVCVCLCCMVDQICSLGALVYGYEVWDTHTHAIWYSIKGTFHMHRTRNKGERYSGGRHTRQRADSLWPVASVSVHTRDVIICYCALCMPKNATTECKVCVRCF